VIARRKTSRVGLGHRRRGAGLVIALVTLLIITSTMAAIIQALLVDLRQTRQTANELQAQWLADSAMSRAAVQLRANPHYEGETWRASVAADDASESSGVAEIRVERREEQDRDQRVIVEARYPDHPWRRVVARRTLLIPPTNDNPTAGASPQETAP
jgi:Tfp pilus assembly protein PilX